MFRLPAIYAAGLPLIVDAFALRPPDAIVRTVRLLANAAVPTLILLVGVRLSQVKLAQETKLIALGALGRLLLAPLIGFTLVALPGLHGLTARICIIQANMPTAVFTTVLNEGFGTRCAAVPATALITTLGSLITLTDLLWMVNEAS